MPNANKTINAPHVTTGNVFDDLGLSHSETLEAKIKADLWRDLINHIEKLDLKQKELAQQLKVHQPDVSNLLNGKISKFGVGTLIQFAVRLNLSVSVKISQPKPIKISSMRAATSHRTTQA